MSLLNSIRRRIAPLNPLLLLYHKILAMLAAFFYRFPSNKIRIVAITGTKGKSTVVQLLSEIFMQAGLSVGVVSTINFRIGDEVWPNETKMTTPGRFKLQRMIREMVDRRCDIAIIETTSQALTQSRLWGVNVDVAVLTNMQRDHLEYHGGFEKYLHAKGLLFAHLSHCSRKGDFQKTAVLPREDTHFQYFDTFLVDHKITFGLQRGEVTAENLELEARATRFTLCVPNERIAIRTGLPGIFQVNNCLAAASAAIACGVPLAGIKRGIERFESLPGIMEPIECGQNFSVFVDYAHTVESLESVLGFLRPLTKGRLFLVFGATGGGRDKAKRPLMGEVADRLCDYIIVTDDDPYEEDRMMIMEQIASGIKRSEGQRFWMIRDRREAIRYALTLARDNDTVIIAGKGSEPVQVIGERYISWDDRKVVREILNAGYTVAV